MAWWRRIFNLKVLLNIYIRSIKWNDLSTIIEAISYKPIIKGAIKGGTNIWMDSSFALTKHATIIRSLNITTNTNHFLQHRDNVKSLIEIMYACIYLHVYLLFSKEYPHCLIFAYWERGCHALIRNTSFPSHWPIRQWSRCSLAHTAVIQHLTTGWAARHKKQSFYARLLSGE